MSVSPRATWGSYSKRFTVVLLRNNRAISWLNILVHLNRAKLSLYNNINNNNNYYYIFIIIVIIIKLFKLQNRLPRFFSEQVMNS